MRHATYYTKKANYYQPRNNFNEINSLVASTDSLYNNQTIATAAPLPFDSYVYTEESPYVKDYTVSSNKYSKTTTKSNNGKVHQQIYKKSNYEICSFANSDFVYNCNNTLRKSKKNLNKHKTSQLLLLQKDFDQNDDDLYNSNYAVVNTFDPYYLYPNYMPYQCGTMHYQQQCMPLHFNCYQQCQPCVSVPINCVHNSQNYGCFGVNSNNSMQRIHIDRPIPIQTFQKIQKKKHYVMQTDGTLGLQAIKLEKPINKNVFVQKEVIRPVTVLPKYQNTSYQRQEYSHDVNEPIIVPLKVTNSVRKRPQTNTKATKSAGVGGGHQVVGRRNVETVTTTYKYETNDNRDTSTPKQVRKPVENKQITKTTEIRKYPIEPQNSGKRVQKEFVELNTISYKGSAKPQSSPKKNEKTNSIANKTDIDYYTFNTATKSFDSGIHSERKLEQFDKDCSDRSDDKFNEKKLMIVQESMSSLDDFVRSPVYKESHNRDAYKYNSDYSSDTISIESIQQPLNVLLSRGSNNTSPAVSQFQPPSFLTKPQSYVANIGENAKFRCSVYGSPFPIVNWYLNKINIREINNPSKYKIYMKNGHFYLKIFNLKQEDSGKIICVIENGVGKSECLAHLIVLDCNLDDSTNRKIINNILKQQDNNNSAFDSIINNNNNKQKIIIKDYENKSYYPFTTTTTTATNNNNASDYNNDSNITTTSSTPEFPVIFNENIIYKIENYISTDDLHHKNNNNNAKTVQEQEKQTHNIIRDQYDPITNKTTNTNLTYRLIKDNNELLTNNNNQILINSIDNKKHQQQQHNEIKKVVYHLESPSLEQKPINHHHHHQSASSTYKTTKFATFDEEELPIYVNVKVNDRVTLTCKCDRVTVCYWVHPKGFVITNNDKYHVYSNDNIHKLDIVSVQIEDSGTYKCMKVNNKCERILVCHLFVHN